MAGRDIESIENGIKNVEKRLHRDVANMCVILQPLAEKIFGNSPGLPRQDTDLLREHFHDIYKSLRLHLVFHSGADLSRVDAKPQLQDLGRSIGLNPEELERRPDENSALDYCADPWSKLLEILSSMIDSEEVPAGSKKHAYDVKEIAEEWLKKMEKGEKRKKEKILLFRPKALAMVSHNDRWYVGSSIAVSQFLRPLCLLRRIDHLKLSLKKAIVSYQPLDTANNQNWSSSASAFAENHEWKEKPPCQNCTMMFESLAGFIPSSTEQGGSGTFLGACAEYRPVDRLLEDKPLSNEENKRINNALEQNKNICKRYFTSFQEIKIKDRNEALEKIKVVFKEHLFGFSPRCNDHFGDRTSCPYIE